MKTTINVGANRFMTVLFVMLISLASFSCGKKENTAGNSQMISGASSKVWKAKKETNASGDKEKLDKEEKQQQIQFFSDGKFSQTSNTESANGTWMYDQSTKTLSLTYANNNVSQNFAVAELDDDDMTLRAPDGSTMELEAK